MAPQITLIKKTKPTSVMSKRIFLDSAGALCSDGTECLMVEGTATRVTAETAAQLAHIVAGCGSNEAIALGSLDNKLPDSVGVTVRGRLHEQSGAITRSREYIDYRAGIPAWVLIDYDTKGMPEHISARIEQEGGMLSALQRVAPGLAKASRVSRASTTAGLLRSDTGASVRGSEGRHEYVLIQDGGDAARFLNDLHDRCWFHGLGWHLIGGAGQLLERSLVDRMVGYGERLCFEGAPVVEPPLMQDPKGRVPAAFEGEAIDSTLIASPLNEYERHLVDEAKSTSAKELSEQAAEVRKQHNRRLAEAVSERFGTPIATAQRLVEARHRGVLFPNIELDFDHLGMVAVSEILRDPNHFVGETLADPLEGPAYGRGKAKVLRAEDGGLLIHSFAHGRGLYLLRHDCDRQSQRSTKFPRRPLSIAPWKYSR